VSFHGINIPDPNCCNKTRAIWTNIIDVVGFAENLVIKLIMASDAIDEVHTRSKVNANADDGKPIMK
jgi:hypothetical protein